MSAIRGRIIYLLAERHSGSQALNVQTVEKIDGFVLYALGAALQPLLFLKGSVLSEEGTSYRDTVRALLLAEAALDNFLKVNAFKLSLCLHAGNDLLTKIRAVRSVVDDFSKRDQHLDLLSQGMINQSATAFLNVIRAELPHIPIYFVSKKGGNDTGDLVENGLVFFPDDLPSKVPSAIPDIKQGTRCIAFELPTAAGYHFHRANEAVLRVYYDAVTNGAPRPRDRSIGKYLGEMDRLNAGDPSIKASLRDLAKYHRNPLIHPEHSLKDANEAIALMNAVHSVVVQMLAAIP